MVGGANSHLESNPIPTRDTQRAQTIINIPKIAVALQQIYVAFAHWSADQLDLPPDCRLHSGLCLCSGTQVKAIPLSTPFSF